MVKLSKAFRHLQSFKALVLGDFMLDTYTRGRVKRVSPEAPVPIMEVVSQESRPGGAGNVVLGLCKLGAQVLAVGRVGSDDGGKVLKGLLNEANTDFLLEEPDYQTPIKNRLVADHQQILRVDTERSPFLSEELEKRLLLSLKELVFSVDVVAISDYGKGFLTHRLIQQVLSLCREKNIPSIVDPKGIDFSKYRGCFALKPNLTEAYAAAKCSPLDSLEEVALQLMPFTENLLITRSEFGISIFDQNGRVDMPVRSKEVKDVTGAGDTVLCLISLALANGLDMHTAAELANIAAGIAIEKVGCVQISLSEIAERLLDIDSQTKVFDESDTYALHQVLKGKKYSLLVLEETQEMSNLLFRTLRKLSAREEELIIYVKNVKPEDEFIYFLSSLSEVDYIVLQTESLKHLCEAIHPEEIYLLEKNESLRVDEAKDLIKTLSCITYERRIPFA